jgi:hypothetical protein
MFLILLQLQKPRRIIFYKWEFCKSEINVAFSKSMAKTIKLVIVMKFRINIREIILPLIKVLFRATKLLKTKIK